ncbi:GTPase domain-containing protein [bacterium]|nr:GTPase domain-containing protein [bacterium]
MSAAHELQIINARLHELLSTEQKLSLVPARESDELLVWFMLGGKDVGKSTFLDALLGTRVSEDSKTDAEGTRRFVAYVHESARDELAARMRDVGAELVYHLHRSETHRRLVLIDSPDFDSRYTRHVEQVREVLEAGVADGAVLLASPAKYRDGMYWNTFRLLTQSVSPRHVLFVLTKADELGEHTDELRRDVLGVVKKRVASFVGDGGDAHEPGIFLIDSIRQEADFHSLVERLMHKVSEREVRVQREENERFAVLRGAERLREHYHLADATAAVRAAADPDRVDQVFDMHFPDAYFAAVADRLAARREMNLLVRERLAAQTGPTLAGIPALVGMMHRIGSWSPLRLRGAEATAATTPEEYDLARALRWGQEEIDDRLADARREALAAVRFENPAVADDLLADAPSVLGDLVQALEDEMSAPAAPVLSRLMRGLLNLPVYMYLVFFVTLLFYPALLLLEAWGVMGAPRVGAALTLDNVKVSIIGFAGYYVMAALWVLRRHRERMREEAREIAARFVDDLRSLLRREVERPLARFRDRFDAVLRDLDQLERRFGLPRKAA